jgi:hypothetical protein
MRAGTAGEHSSKHDEGVILLGCWEMCVPAALPYGRAMTRTILCAVWLAATLLVWPAAGAASLPSDPVAHRIDPAETLVRVPGGSPFLSIGAGMLDTGYSFEGGSSMQLFATQQLEGRFLFDWFTAEGSLLHALPVSGSSATRAFFAQLRLGWTGRRVSITGGPSFQLAPDATPQIQLLPTVRVEWKLTDAGLALSGGVFDVHGEAPLRVSLELPRFFGFGYVAPLGVEAHAAVPISDDFELRAQGLALRLANATAVMLLASAAFTGFDIGGAP